MRISFDYDGTLTTAKGRLLAISFINDNNDVYIISARSSKTDLNKMAKRLGINESRVFATGSNSNKIEKIKELNIARHYDNNIDVVNALGSKGKKI